MCTKVRGREPVLLRVSLRTYVVPGIFSFTNLTLVAAAVRPRILLHVPRRTAVEGCTSDLPALPRRLVAGAQRVVGSQALGVEEV